MTLRLGTKIIIGFICISLLLAFIGFVTDHFTSDIREEQMRYVNEASEVVIHTGEMERSLFQSLIFLNGIREGLEVDEGYNTIQEIPAVAELTNKFEDELVKFELSFNSLEIFLEQDEQLPEDLTKLFKSYQVYRSISREWLNLGVEDFDQANLMFINSIEPYFRNNIIPEISRLRVYVLSMQEERNKVMEESLEQAAVVNFVATLLSILLAIALAIYIYRSIANPLSRLSTAAKRLGKGNLDERIEIESKDEIGELAEAFNTMAKGLQKTTVSKTYVDNIIESIHEALFVVDNDGILKRVNTAATVLLGYNAEEMIGRPAEKFFDLEGQETQTKVKQRTERSFEFSLMKQDGNKVPVLFSEAVLLNSQGEKVGKVSVASDISERIAQEEEIRSSLKEKEVMLAEIHHRVKNNLAVISGLLQLQSFSTGNGEVEKALRDSQMRIQSIALVHEMLYESESLAYIKYDKYVNDLLQAIQSMHLNSDQEIDLVAEIEPISLTVNQAIPCSLLINELIVNAFKYVFKEDQKGKITVKINKQGEKIIVAIVETENGFDPSIFEKSASLGATLIQTLSKQLGAEFKVVENKERAGSKVLIEFVHEQ